MAHLHACLTYRPPSPDPSAMVTCEGVAESQHLYGNSGINPLYVTIPPHSFEPVGSATSDLLLGSLGGSRQHIFRNSAQDLAGFEPWTSSTRSACPSPLKPCVAESQNLYGNSGINRLYVTEGHPHRYSSTKSRLGAACRVTRAAMSPLDS